MRWIPSKYERTVCFACLSNVEGRRTALRDNPVVALTTGSRLGPYEVTGPLGRGGMGEVYRARDTKLGRDVALKVLPEPFATDPDRLARFQREARVLASLSHPNIGAIHGLEESDGVRALVLELVEGPTLADRITQGPIPLEEVLSIARQICVALEAAHELGIIHRDLKPANIKMRHDGMVKVLDFGLAKVQAGDEPDADLSQSPTLTADDTRRGVILGTAAYMSPEQARGQPLDKRTDVWAFGCVLFEMLTCRVAFRGDTVSDTVVAILTLEPDWHALPAETPTGIRELLSRCLEKDLKRRLRDIGDAPFLFEKPRVGPASVVPQISSPPAGGGSRRRARMLASALTLLAVLGAGLYVFSGRQQEAAIDSIAVLPFGNVSGDPDAEYLSDGITDSVMNSLSQLRDLRVTARSMVFRYKGKQFDPLQLGRDLQVRAVLTGRVSQRGDTLIVATELMDVSNGSQVWGEQYNRPMKDVLVLQDEITREISEKLRLRLTREEEDRLFRRHTENAEAYQLYLKGRYYFDTRSAAGVKQSTEYFQQAIRTDPNYALAYAGLANSYIPSDTALPPRSLVPLAKAAAAKALETDPRLAEAHIAQGRVLQHGDWDWPAAEREFKGAIELNPKNPEAHHMYSHYLMPLGRAQEALSEAKRAMDLDPSDVLINMHLGWAYLFARQYDEAVSQLKKAIGMDPSLAIAYEMQGRAYLQSEKYEEAIEAFQKGIALQGGTGENPAAGLSRAYALSGRTDDARKGLTTLKELYKRGQASAYAVATSYIALGDKEQALQWLDTAYQERGGSLLLMKVDPAFDSLQADARFLKLARRIGLTP